MFVAPFHLTLLRKSHLGTSLTRFTADAALRTGASALRRGRISEALCCGSPAVQPTNCTKSRVFLYQNRGNTGAYRCFYCPKSGLLQRASRGKVDESVVTAAFSSKCGTYHI